MLMLAGPGLGDRLHPCELTFNAGPMPMAPKNGGLHLMATTGKTMLFLSHLQDQAITR